MVLFCHRIFYSARVKLSSGLLVVFIVEKVLFSYRRMSRNIVFMDNWTRRVVYANELDLNIMIDWSIIKAKFAPRARTLI